MNSTIEFQKLPERNQIIVKHSYQDSAETLWNAFTKTEMLEKWWAPKPFKMVVITNNFEEGKYLHYYMLSPEGEKYYSISKFLKIEPLKSFEVLDDFCDENLVINTELPGGKWLNTFDSQNGITTVVNTLTFDTAEDMSKLLEMRFEEGYRQGLNQLYELLKK